MVARTVHELRAALPEADDLLVGLLRVAEATRTVLEVDAEATRTVLEVDGAGLTLVHEGGPPRWVAATDAAMELLEQVQHDFGEGPYLEAYAQDRAVGVEDLRAAPARTRINAVVGQLHVCGVLSVPVRLAGQPVGTLDVYSTQPRAWTTRELEALGEFAAVAGELVHTSVELASHKLEVAHLQQALTSRVWIEQAKEVLAATQGTDPEATFQQLRARARASSFTPDRAGSGPGFGTQRDPERLVFFSDAVFAIAVTLLVLEIHPPEDTRHLLHGLAALWPSYLSYAITFLLIGQVWANHHVMFDHIRSADRMVLFLNTLLLMDIAFLPFAASVLAVAFRTGHGQRHRNPAGRPAPRPRHGGDRRVHPRLLAADPRRGRQLGGPASSVSHDPHQG
jgi:Endosomal/lysosomal potassium channel TMEM175/GAF domain/ANTAR domain